MLYHCDLVHSVVLFLFQLLPGDFQFPVIFFMDDDCKNRDFTRVSCNQVTAHSKTTTAPPAGLPLTFQTKVLTIFLLNMTSKISQV